jgi:spore germination protein
MHTDQAINTAHDTGSNGRRGEGGGFWRRYGRAIAIGLIAALLVAAGVFGVNMRKSFLRAHTLLENAYKNNFNALGDHMITIGNDLIKLRVCTSPAQQAVLLYTIWREAGQAQCMLSQLPVDEQSSSTMLQFVNRLGDFCFTLGRRVDQGAEISEGEYDVLRLLETQSAQVASQIETLREGGVDWETAQAAWAGGENAPTLDGIGQMSESISEYPALIYDGPYAERAENIEPKAASGEEVPYEQAVETAQRFLAGTYVRNEDQGAQVPTYSMTCTREDEEVFEVRVTKKAGLFYSILPNAAAATDIFPTGEQVPQLVEVAKAYLEAHGFPEVKSAYAQYYAGSAVLNMVPVQDGVILYPDLVKVWVDIGTLEVIGLDAHNFTVNHIRREFPTDLMDEGALTERVAKRLSIENVRLAMIPYNAVEERLCYEFTGENGGNTFAIYLSAQTGETLDIKLIIDAEDGTFTY